ncbi:hypothetical protein L3Y34_013406 [Caenorhabditis briggsae]|uniref:Ubiquitin-like protease family profile domain-containing protein n=1 Tax=Caenorhabditis briggsae TaxID=6238 RepID=A0AAE8ZWU0_CAEBR|nr:hypothetical protein L3Y34_013406 [Caenorhabditis briggsae]
MEQEQSPVEKISGTPTSTASSSLTEPDTTAQSHTLLMPAMFTNDSIAPNSNSDHLLKKDAIMTGSLSQIPEASGLSITNIESSLNLETSTSLALLLGNSGSSSNPLIPYTSQDSSVWSGNSTNSSSPDIIVEKVIPKKQFNTWCLDHETGREAWICDEVIHWFLSKLVNNQFAFVDPCSWKMYKRHGVASIQRTLNPSKMYLSPVCEKSHWILLIFDASSIWYADSLRKEPRGHVKKFMDEMNRNRRYFDRPIPA